MSSSFEKDVAADTESSLQFVVVVVCTVFSVNYSLKIVLVQVLISSNDESNSALIAVMGCSSSFSDIVYSFSRAFVIVSSRVSIDSIIYAAKCSSPVSIVVSSKSETIFYPLDPGLFTVTADVSIRCKILGESHFTRFPCPFLIKNLYKDNKIYGWIELRLVS